MGVEGLLASFQGVDFTMKAWIWIVAALTVVLVPVNADLQVYVGYSEKGDSPNCGETMQNPCKTLQYALDSRISSGGTILILPGTYPAIDIVVPNMQVTISSVSKNAKDTILDASNVGGVFRVAGVQQEVVLSYLTIQKGRNDYGGCIYVDRSILTLDHVVLSDCEATEGGGGVYVTHDASTLLIGHSLFVWGRTNGYGGGLLAGLNSHVLVFNTTFVLCEAFSESGGGVAILPASSPTSIEIADCVFSGNRAGAAQDYFLTGSGPGITGTCVQDEPHALVCHGSTITRTSSMGYDCNYELYVSSDDGDDGTCNGTFVLQCKTIQRTINNFLPLFGDGNRWVIILATGSTFAEEVDLTNVKVELVITSGDGDPSLTAIDGGFTCRNGKSSSSGGGIVTYVASSSFVHFDDMIIKDCTANQASGCIRLYGGITTITNSKIHGCVATKGAAIHAVQAECDVHILHSEIWDSPTSSTGGGALYTESKVVVEHSTIHDCVSQGSGAGIYVHGGELIMINSHIWSCTSQRGGGIYGAENTLSNYSITLNDSSISYCSATGDGGAIMVDFSTYDHFVTLHMHRTDISHIRSGVGYYKGGAIYLRGLDQTKDRSVAYLTEVHGFNCTASSGAFMYILDASAFLSNVEIYDAHVTANGGAFYTAKGILEISDSICTMCSATRGGVVYAVLESQEVRLNNVVMYGSEAAWGGALFSHLDPSVFDVVDSSFCGNMASESGYDVYGPINLINCEQDTGDRCCPCVERMNASSVSCPCISVAITGEDREFCGVSMDQACRTIQYAVDSIVSPNPMSVLLFPGIFSGNGNRMIVPDDKNIHFHSFSGNPADTILDGDGTHRVFDVQPQSAELVISDVTIRNGFTDEVGGCIRFDSALSVLMSNVHINHCETTDSGGAIGIRGISNITMHNVLIADSSGKYGGGIAIQDAAQVYITDSIIERCNAIGGGGGGGGILCGSMGSDFDVYLVNTIISECDANFGGGLVIGAGKGSLHNVSVDHCNALQGGGFYFAEANVTMDDIYIVSCNASSGSAWAGSYSIIPVPDVSNVHLCDIPCETEFLEEPSWNVPSYEISRCENEVTVFVDVGGVNSPLCGTSSNPCNTILYGLQQVQQNGSSVIVQLGSGVYVDLEFGNITSCPFLISITIQGQSGDPSAVVLDGQGIRPSLGKFDRAYTNLQSLFVYNLTLTNGSSDAGGAISLYNQIHLTIGGCRISYNNAVYGGGIYLDSLSTATMLDTIVIGNLATKRGGGIYHSNTLIHSLDMKNVELRENTALRGAAVCLVEGHSMLADEVTVCYNVAEDDWREDEFGLSQYPTLVTPLILCELSIVVVASSMGVDGPLCGDLGSPCQTMLTGMRRRASADSVVMMVTGTHETDMILTSDMFPALHLEGMLAKDVLLDGASSHRSLGRVIQDGHALHLKSLTLSFGKTLGHGGGLEMSGYGVELVMDDVIVKHCEAARGGGISLFNMPSLVQIINCTFEENNATNAGGLYVYGNSSLEVDLEGTSFIANVGVEEGGGLYVEGAATLNLIYTHMTLNEAGVGGGMFIQSVPSLYLDTGSFTSNQANGINGGGAFSLNNVQEVLATGDLLFCFNKRVPPQKTGIDHTIYDDLWGRDLRDLYAITIDNEARCCNVPNALSTLELVSSEAGSYCVDCVGTEEGGSFRMPNGTCMQVSKCDCQTDINCTCLPHLREPFGESLTPCPPGNKCNKAMDTRALCEPGHYCPKWGMSDAESSMDVPVNTYAPAGAAFYSPCPPHSFVNVIESVTLSACLCEAGFDPSVGCNPLVAECGAIPVQCGVMCSSGFFSRSGDGRCSPCAAGTYTNLSVGFAECQLCSVGYYCTPGSTSPTQNKCPPQTYCALGSSTPTDCPRGHYCPDGFASISCPDGVYGSDTRLMNATCSGECPGGYMCTAGTTDPVACPQGTASSIGAFSCTPCGNGATSLVASSECSCSTGYYRLSPPMVLDEPCLKCPDGQFCVGGDALPIGCEAGWYCPAGTTISIHCPAGSWCGVNASAPVSCPAGVFGDELYLINDGCSGVCPEGYQCPSGTINPTACDLGTYCQEGSGFATVCSPGSWCNGTDQIACAAGTYGAAMGLSDPSCSSPCPAGSACPKGSSQPSVCPPSTASEESASSCTPCGIGTASPVGSDHCPCAERYYRLVPPSDLSTPCLECEEGQFCEGGGVGPQGCRAGYYCPAGSGEEVECPMGSWCGVNVSVPSACAAGRFGNVKKLNDSVCSGWCPAGYQCPSGTTEPVECEMGSYCPERSSFASTCNPGSYCNGTHKFKCPAGIYGASSGLDNENCDGLCPPGYACPEGTAQPAACPPGTVAEEGAFSCSPCGRGTSSSVASSECPCTAGYYRNGVPLIVTEDCLQCAGGQFCVGGDALPIGCEAGWYCPAGTTISIHCPAGSWCGVNVSAPVSCPAGVFGDELYLINDGCSGVCPEGYQCPSGTINPTACDLGTYCQEGSGFATVCSPGSWCNGTDQIACAAGVYGASSGLDNENCDGLCPPGYACPEGTAQPAACPPGTVAEEGAFSCSPCGRGTSSSVASSECPCTAGYYRNGVPLIVTEDCLQCPGGQFCSGDDALPIGCEAGWYCPAGTTISIHCPAGSWCGVNVSAPVSCPAGVFGDELYLINDGCSGVCPEGYQCPSGTIDPIPCDMGTYCQEGSGFATVCSPGSWCNGTDQIACAAGRYGLTPRLTSVDCTGPCPAGYSCPEGTAQPFSCPPGTASEQGASSCTGCGAGATSLVGSSTCDCVEGYYRSGPALTLNASCTLCEEGYFCNQGIRHNCSAGYYCSRGSFDPVDCVIGSYCEKKVGSPTSCPAGTFGNTPNLKNASCSGPCPRGYECPMGTAYPLPCPLGTSCTGGSSFASPCNPGHWCNGTHENKCQKGYFGTSPRLSQPECDGACPAGYSCEEGTTQPQSCPPGTASEMSASACTPCGEGTDAGVNSDSCPCAREFYRPDLNALLTEPCLPCPEGGVCDGGDAQPRPQDGYWPSGDNQFISCPTPGACSGTLNASCAEGHTGPLCGLCEDNYYATDGGTCEECSKQGGDIAVRVAGFVVLLMVMAIMWTKRKKLKQLKTGSKPAIAFFQVVNSMSIVYAVAWPSISLSVFGLFSFASVELVDMFTGGGGCNGADHIGHWDRLLFYLIAPIIMALLLGWFGKSKAKGFALAGMFLVVVGPVIGAMGLRTFDTVSAGSKSYVASDVSLEVGTSEYTKAAAVGALLAIIYVVLLPAFFITKLVHGRKLTDDAAIDLYTKKYGFLFIEFKEEYNYWEMVEYARKFFLLSAIQFVGRGTFFQTALGFFVCVGAALLFSKLKPVKSKNMRRFHGAALWALAVVMFAAMMLNAVCSSGTCDSTVMEENVASGLAGGIIVCVVIAVVLQGIVSMRQVTTNEEDKKQPDGVEMDDIMVTEMDSEMFVTEQEQPSDWQEQLRRMEERIRVSEKQLEEKFKEQEKQLLLLRQGMSE